MTNISPICQGPATRLRYKAPFVPTLRGGAACFWLAEFPTFNPVWGAACFSLAEFPTFSPVVLSLGMDCSSCVQLLRPSSSGLLRCFVLWILLHIILLSTAVSQLSWKRFLTSFSRPWPIPLPLPEASLLLTQLSLNL